jgi:hypothetical protein
MLHHPSAEGFQRRTPAHPLEEVIRFWIISDTQPMTGIGFANALKVRLGTVGVFLLPIP